MKQPILVRALAAGVLAVGLAACGASPETNANGSVQSAATATVAPTRVAEEVGQPVDTPPLSLEQGVSGSGTVEAAQEADLIFTVQGTVQQVLVEEGAVVTAGQVLAVLDLRTFDQQVRQAEAQLAQAQAGRVALDEDPRAFDAAAARAQVLAAQASIAELNKGPEALDVQSAQAALNAAQINVQATRDQLSAAKTQSEAQMKQLVEQVTQAQASYAQAKANWEYVRDTGRDPIQPDVTNQQGEKSPNATTDGQANNYYTQFVQAEAALKAAEESLQAAVVAFDSARQAEVTGIQAAEQQVVQAQAALERLNLPADSDRVAAAQAQLAQARASQAQLTADPRASQVAQADAGIASAEAAVELARINREQAEIRAPFAGVVSAVSIDPGDSSSTGNDPAIRVVNVDDLHVDAQISDIDIPNVQVGQVVTIFADALPGQSLQGKVRYIAPTATIVGSIRTYLVRVTLDDPQGLRAGMSVRVELAP